MEQRLVLLFIDRFTGRRCFYFISKL